MERNVTEQRKKELVPEKHNLTFLRNSKYGMELGILDWKEGLFSLNMYTSTFDLVSFMFHKFFVLKVYLKGRWIYH